ncbi:MAG TPA: hypothetical protein VI385_13545 [Flavisolibacter sp.]
MLITILPQVLLIVGLGALIVFLVTTCIKFTKGPISTDALKRQLRLLQLKFVTAETINPDVERREMEILQNKIKTSNDALIISDDNDLKLLSGSNCKYIQLEMDNVNLANRSSWIQFRELMLGFDRFYFQS